MKFKRLLILLLICSSCSKEQTSNYELLNEDSKTIGLDHFKKTDELSSVKKGSKGCLDNCFYEPDFNFWNTTSYNPVTSVYPQVTFHWNYGGSIVLNPNVCSTTVQLQFRAIQNITTCENDIVTGYSENFSIDITNEFLASSSGQITLDVAVGSNAVIQNLQLPNKIYEFRIVINAECQPGPLLCCYDTDWDCFSVT